MGARAWKLEVAVSTTSVLRRSEPALRWGRGRRRADHAERRQRSEGEFCHPAALSQVGRMKPVGRGNTRPVREIRIVSSNGPMRPPSGGAGRRAGRKVMTMTSLWRQAFDALERPLAAASESWVQSKTFMDLAVVGVRMQRRLAADSQRMTEQWLHAWGMPARGDLFRLMNQVASLERQVRDLERELQTRDEET